MICSHGRPKRAPPKSIDCALQSRQAAYRAKVGKRMRWRSLRTTIGWTCSVIVGLELVLGILGAVVVRVCDVPHSFRVLAGPSPWFSVGLSMGTGVFINGQGDVLTNDHVIAGCRRVTIAGYGFRARPARLIAKLANSFQDLAVLHIDQTPTAWLAFEEQPEPQPNTDLTLKIPDPISVLGFPANMEGIVPRQMSVKSITLAHPTGDFSPRHLLLNIVATIQPGNSGSPVVDGRGHIVGLVAIGTFPDRRSHEKGLTGESGEAIYGRYISDWLHGIGVPVAVVVPEQAIQATGTLPSAVVRVFCFGRLDTSDISAGATRKTMWRDAWLVRGNSD